MNRSRAVLVFTIVGTLGLSCRSKNAPTPAPSEEASKPKEVEGREEAHLPDSVHLTAAAMAEANIQTWKVQPVDLEHLLTLNGTVEHNENRLLHVASNAKGRVLEIPADLGAVVRKGDPLVVLESIELARAREEWVKAMADLRVASAAYDRARRLAEAKAMSAGELQSREGDYLSKRAAADGARRALNLLGEHHEEGERFQEVGDSRIEPPTLVVRAPFSGRVIDRKVTPGTLVEAMQPLVTLADVSNVWVFLKAYEKDLALLKKGLPVSVRTEAYPQETFHGVIDFLGGVVEESTRTIRVRATVQNPGEKLRPGMFIKGLVQVPKPASEAKPILAVPQAALQTLEGRTVVFVQKEPGEFRREFVETGHTFEGVTEVLSGVRAGDVIATEGSFVLKSEFARATLKDQD